MIDDPAMRQKRLLYQARHRGTQEGDLVLGSFAERYICGMGSAELDQFEALIGETDADLMDWMSGRAAVPSPLDGPVLKLLIDFKNNL
jgi:antitoxin CptB